MQHGAYTPGLVVRMLETARLALSLPSSHLSCFCLFLRMFVHPSSEGAHQLAHRSIHSSIRLSVFQSSYSLIHPVHVWRDVMLPILIYHFIIPCRHFLISECQRQWRRWNRCNATRCPIESPLLLLADLWTSHESNDGYTSFAQYFDIVYKQKLLMSS